MATLIQAKAWLALDFFPTGLFYCVNNKEIIINWKVMV